MGSLWSSQGGLPGGGWPWGGQQGTGGTHNKQGAAPVIARPSQVGPCLPPRPQTFAVRPGGQPGREPRRGSRPGRLGAWPARLPTHLPRAPSASPQSRPQTADPAALGPRAGGTGQPGVWCHTVGGDCDSGQGGTRTHTHEHAHTGSTRLACTGTRAHCMLAAACRFHISQQALAGRGHAGPGSLEWTNGSRRPPRAGAGGQGAWQGEGLGLPALERRWPVGKEHLPRAYQGPPQPPTPTRDPAGEGSTLGWGYPPKRP